jgi:hypothetical protein
MAQIPEQPPAKTLRISVDSRSGVSLRYQANRAPPSLIILNNSSHRLLLASFFLITNPPLLGCPPRLGGNAFFGWRRGLFDQLPEPVNGVLPVFLLASIALRLQHDGSIFVDAPVIEAQQF